MAEAVAEATRMLDDAYVASPRVDAELLAAFVLRIPRGRLVLAGEFDEEQVERFRQLVARRAGRVPLQHLTGSAPFRHLELKVGPGVFVPRPETEVLVGWALGWLGRRPGALVVDLCAGSGAIAAAVAAEANRPEVYAVERDPTALSWLRRNAADLATAGTPVTVVAGDATDPAVLTQADGHVDLVLSNPPYVPDIAAATLPPEVLRHDPHDAVFGGFDGLDVIRPLVARAATLLRPGGAIAVEHDETHAYVLPAMIRADPRFEDVEIHFDLAKRPRFTTATRSDYSE